MGSLAARRVDEFDRSGFDRESSSIHPILSRTGGIRPAERRRSRFALSLVEREEISRGLERGLSLRSIGRQLCRSASTISREVKRNGGCEAYRAVRSDQAAWDRADRPKPCKLACNPVLRRTVSRKLQLNWSPEQIAGWLKRKYRGEEHNQVSHETIYRSLFVQARGVLKKELMRIFARSGRCGAPVIPASNGADWDRLRIWSQSGRDPPWSKTVLCPDIGRETSSRGRETVILPLWSNAIPAMSCSSRFPTRTRKVSCPP